MFTRHVNVTNNNSGYDVKVGRGLFENIGVEISNLKFKSHVLTPDGLKFAVITDSNVGELYLETCIKSLREYGDAAAVIFNAGEASKNINTFGQILEGLAANKLTRGDLIIALGGGVVGDMAGFAAGCYMRGVKFIQVPTSLLAAVDSSVGGKTAIDLTAGKNLAGLFYQPELVLCDIDLLKSLPEIEMQCGMAEALKTGILRGDDLFKFFENGNAHENLDEVIALCVDYKAGVVERDEREQGERKLLNLGHTIGHAIELCSNYEIKHGLAIAQGMKIINKIAFRLGLSSQETFNRIDKALNNFNFDFNLNFKAGELFNAILADKKRKGDVITLVLPVEIGACELKDVNINALPALLELGLMPEE
ncbi:MAG: 3-dehydroquinate synthase [Synergistaceae bacterium]|nr:3-dehydroquinate synthase [Synergistaceae bacterium]